MQGPGAFNNVLANTVVVFGPTGTVTGLFVYKPGTAPGPGNIPIAWISESSSDPYGNALPVIGGDIVSFDQLTQAFSQLKGGRFQEGVTTDFAPGEVVTQNGTWIVNSPVTNNTDVEASLEMQSLHAPFNTTGFPVITLQGGTVLRSNSGALAIIGGLAVTGGETTDTLDVTGTSTLTGAVTEQGGESVTGGSTIDTLHVTGTSTLTGAVTESAGVSTTGGTVTDTLKATGTGEVDGPLLLGSNTTPATPGSGAKMYANFASTALDVLTVSGVPANIPAVQVDNTRATVTQASLTNLTNAWTIPGGDAQAKTVYKLSTGGFGTNAATTPVGFSIQLTFGGNNVASLSGIPAIGAAAGALRWHFEGEVTIIGNGAGGTCFASGVFTISQGTTTVSYPIASAANVSVNTTLAQTLALQFSWASITNAPTITSGYSILERQGP